MRLRIPTLMILLQALLALQSMSAESESIKHGLLKQQIKPSETYSGTLVQELLEAVQTEAERSIEAAYEDGYKQGLLESAVDAEYYRVQTTELQAEAERLMQEKQRSRWLYPVCLLGGALAGCAVYGTVQFFLR